MDDPVCILCDLKLSEHVDTLSDDKDCDLKCYFKCTQSNDVLCDCDPDTFEMDSVGYDFIEETQHACECKYYGYTTIYKQYQGTIIITIKNNATQEENRICSYDICYCLNNVKL